MSEVILEGRWDCRHELPPLRRLYKHAAPITRIRFAERARGVR